MSESVGQTPSSTPGTLPPITVTAPSEAMSDNGPLSFHTLLSELNPLQYIPVVGTIYRAATGDTIPETAREIGSLLVSGLIGGPIGVATNLGLLGLEKLTGIDPEKIGTALLADIGIGDAAPAANTPAASVPGSGAGAAATSGAASGAAALSGSAATPAAHVAPAGPTVAPAPATAPVAWSHAQLVAYGVTKSANGELRHGDLRGADVLNDLELTRLAEPVSPA